MQPRRREEREDKHEEIPSRLSSRSSRLRGCILISILAMLSGCADPPVQTPVISGDVSAPAVDANPQKTSTGIITGSMYRLQMPLGANSLDPAFWKPLEEDVVDVQTDFRLTTNG